MIDKIKARIKYLADRIELHRAYRKVFCSPDGEKVLQHLMKECGILAPKIQTDHNLLLVRQGQQHIVYSILKTIGKDPLELQHEIQQSLQQEHHEKDTI